MKKLTLFTLISTALLALTPSQKSQALKIANTASKAYLDYLEAEILKTLKNYSMEDALMFCKTKAYPLSMKFALQMSQKFHTKIKIKRISFKNRNNSNYPNITDQPILKKLSKSQKPIVKEYGKMVVVYEPIKISNLCLLCHGTNINPQLHKIINKLYPNDKAIGYKLGDFRGAVVITIEKKGLK